MKIHYHEEYKYKKYAKFHDNVVGDEAYKSFYYFFKNKEKHAKSHMAVEKIE